MSLNVIVHPGFGMREYQVNLFYIEANCEKYESCSLCNYLSMVSYF
ncbi:hypothetical protein PEC302110_30710 [Pectobacterium araliae]|uniref:Uncharacterized protein n=1 Tax=Pectobacterium araliae TaxID=3073862 RepID=A0AAN0KI59_9GAMM|nr:hypothetical protein PEC302110_30710 [Pectobacterium sp. MAFF 302110]